MNTIAIKIAIAIGCALTIAACDRGGGDPSGSATTAPSAPAPVVSISTPAETGTPDRSADEAAIKRLITTVYKRTENSDTPVWPQLTRRFAAAWKSCYDLQKQVNARLGDDSATYGECSDDAGSFIPGQDLDPDVASRTSVARIDWTSNDSAVATVKMRIFRDEKTDTVVTLRIAREDGTWLVDDLDHEAGAAGTGYRAMLEQALPSLRQRLPGKD